MYFNKNISAMPEKMNKLKEYLLKINTMGYDSEIECGVEEIAGRKILYAVKDGNLFQLDTMYDQSTMLELWYHGMDPKFNSKFLMFGIGNGMFIEKIMEETGDDTSFYVYEPYVDVLFTVFHEFDLSKMLKTERVSIMLSIIEKNDNAFYDSLANLLDYTDVKGTRNCIYPNYNVLFEDAYKKYDASVQELMDSLQANRQVLENFGDSYYRNTFINAPYLCYGKSIENLWAHLNSEMPVIIVSSGPSLSKNVDELKRAKGKAFMIAADSAVNVLLNHDIIPDMFVCVDSKKHAGHFVNPLIKDIPMLCMLHTSVKAMENHNAPCFFINDMNPHVADFTIPNAVVLPSLSTGGSVANNAMSFAELMGLKKFILVGQDLAYTNNKTHAEGSLRSTWNIDIDYSKCFVEGQDGEQILSSNEFRLYRDWIEREIVEHDYITVVNATEGGAKIHGAIQSTLKDAIDQYCVQEYDMTKIFSDTGYLMDSVERDEFKKHIEGTSAELKKIETVAQKGIGIYEKMEALIRDDKYQSQKFITYYRQTEDIIKELQDNSAMYYAECTIQKAVSEYLKQAYDIEDNQRNELKKAVGQGKEYLILVRNAADRIIPEIDSYCKNAEDLYEKLRQEYENGKLFVNDGMQLIWEQLIKFITPEIEQDDFYNLYVLLKSLDGLQDNIEYGKLINKIFVSARGVRKEGVLYKAAIYMYLLSINPDNKEYVEEMDLLCRTNNLLKKRHINFLYENMKDIDENKAKTMYESVILKYSDVLGE